MSSSRCALILALSGCASGTDPALRQAWLVDAIVDDNRVWLSRDTGPLEQKYAEMAADRYAFLRATGGVALRDWSRPGTDREETAFVRSAEAAAVLLAVDPHPENIGTYLPGPGPEPTDPTAVPPLVLELTDLDGAGFGPWTWDLRRGAQGLAVLLESAGCDPDCREDVLEAQVGGYIDELRTRAAGNPGWSAAFAGDGGGIVDELVSEVRWEGVSRARLLGWTRETPDGLRLRIDPEVVDGDGTRPLDPEEQAQADRLVAAWVADHPDVRVFDVARRYGIGIASLPAIRYVVVFDLGDDGPDDDQLAFFREVVDPPEIPGLRRGTSWLWDSNGARVVAAAQALWTRPDADPWAGALTDGAMTFKVVTGSAFNDTLDHADIAERVAEGRYEQADLEVLADVLGRQLAGMHARAPTATGGAALDAIAADVGSQEARLAAEVVAQAEADILQLDEDHRLFVDALDALGPLLGAERLDPR